MTPAQYLAYLCSRLEVHDNEIERKETELKATLRELREKPEDAVLLAERDRLVGAIAGMNDRRKILEDKLPGVGTIGGDAGAAAGLDVGSAARAGPSAAPGAETAVGAGSLPAAPVSGGLGVRPTAGQSLGGTADAAAVRRASYFTDLLSSALYGMTFTLYDGVDVAMRLVSHARANGFRGEVRHVSTSRSDFTLLLDTDDEASKQTFKRFVKWLATQVPVRAPGAQASTAFARAAEEDAARVEVTSDPFNPLTRDRELLHMYYQGPLTVFGSVEVRRALEDANTAAEKRGRLSQSSLGTSSASRSYAE